jgi:hypothetical protein
LVRGNWRLKAQRVEVGTQLQPNFWYRSPLWDKDHVIGLRSDLLGDNLSWCGLALDVARDWEEGEEYAGLWYTNRGSAKCAYCNRRQKEWDEFGSISGA